MTDSAQVGEIVSGAGVTSNLRSGRLGQLIVSQLMPGGYENAKAGRTFALQLLATTTGVAAGNINLGAAAASSQFALWNPTTSGVDVVIRKVYVGLISGTIVGGPAFHSTYTTSLPTIASVGTAYNMYGMVVGAPVAKFIASAAGAAATGGSALLTVRPMNLTFSAGTYAALAGSLAFENVDGEIVLKPGTGWTPTWAAAGTSVLNTYGVTWDEVPV